MGTWTLRIATALKISTLDVCILNILRYDLGLFLYIGVLKAAQEESQQLQKIWCANPGPCPIKYSGCGSLRSGLSRGLDMHDTPRIPGFHFASMVGKLDTIATITASLVVVTWYSHDSCTFSTFMSLAVILAIVL